MGRRAGSVAKWILHTRPCMWLIRNVLPNMHLPTRGLRGDVVLEGRKLLRLADIILSLSPLGMSAMLTRGFDHAALHVGDGDIAEMTRKGFGIVTWEDFCRHSRRVLVLRCSEFRKYDTDDEYPTAVALEALSFRRRSYDFQFECGDSELTCAEMPIAADYEGRLGISPRLNRRFDYRYNVPQQLLEADNVIVVWDSAGKLRGVIKQ